MCDCLASSTSRDVISLTTFGAVRSSNSINRPTKDTYFVDGMRRFSVSTENPKVTAIRDIQVRYCSYFPVFGLATTRTVLLVVPNLRVVNEEDTRGRRKLEWLGFATEQENAAHA